MTKIIKFPEGSDDEYDDDNIRVTKEFCNTCGGGLELWTSSDLVAYGVCSYCDMGVGSQPIILVKGTEH
jgi:hypothetical protein